MAPKQFLATPDMPCHFWYYKILYLIFPLHQDTLLAIPATPKNFYSHSHNTKTFRCAKTTLFLPFRYAKTLYLPFSLRQNTFIAINAKPKLFSCHSRCAKTLFLPFLLCQNTIPGHNWSHLVTPGHIWQHLVTSWQHLVTFWQHLVTTNCQHADQNCDLLQWRHL